MRKNSKRGSAAPVLVAILLITVLIIGMFVKMNWKRFKAETSFAFHIILIVAVILIVIFLIIRHKIRKARKAKEKARKAESERKEK